MSNFSNILRLYPTVTTEQVEHLEPDVTFPCPYCSGNGWHWSNWANTNGESIKEICTHCNGSGRLKAKVTIHWEPVGPPISIFQSEGEE